LGRVFPEPPVGLYFYFRRPAKGAASRPNLGFDEIPLECFEILLYTKSGSFRHGKAAIGIDFDPAGREFQR
jgi:hypothetical protein